MNLWQPAPLPFPRQRGFCPASPSDICQLSSGRNVPAATPAINGTTLNIRAVNAHPILADA